MEMLTFPILIVTVLITLWLTSHIARQLHARHWKIPVIFGAWVVGFIFTVASLVLLDLIELDPMVKKSLQIAAPIFFTTLSYMLFTQLGPVSAFTTNIAGLFIGLILSVVAIVSLGMSVEKSFASANLLYKTSKAQVASLITGEEVVVPELAKKPKVVEPVVEEVEPEYTTTDYLAPEAQAALEKQKNRTYTDPRYRDMSIYNARRAIGMRVRMSWKDGKQAAGKLEAVQGGDLIVTLRRKEGVAQVPIAMSRLKKLEVYR